MQEHLHVGLVRQTLAVREALGGLQIPHSYPDGDALGLRNASHHAPFLGCLLELLHDEVGVGVPPGRLFGFALELRHRGCLGRLLARHQPAVAAFDHTRLTPPASDTRRSAAAKKACCPRGRESRRGRATSCPCPSRRPRASWPIPSGRQTGRRRWGAPRAPPPPPPPLP